MNNSKERAILSLCIHEKTSTVGASLISTDGSELENMHYRGITAC